MSFVYRIFKNWHEPAYLTEIHSRFIEELAGVQEMTKLKFVDECADLKEIIKPHSRFIWTFSSGVAKILSFI